MSRIKLAKKIIYSGTLAVKTGLHIGGTNAALNIGGPDRFVVRNPINNIPYIPGSSLKGKMRALVEIANGETNNGKPTNDPHTKSGKLFGVFGDTEHSLQSRLIVRDAELVVYDDDLGIDETFFSNTDLPFTESKTEATIDRVTAKANPRTFERVPAGAKFKLNMVLNVFESDNEKQLKETLKQAIQLLHDDYLGGHGSRGYGQVEIDIDVDGGIVKSY